MTTGTSPKICEDDIGLVDKGTFSSYLRNFF